MEYENCLHCCLAMSSQDIFLKYDHFQQNLYLLILVAADVWLWACQFYVLIAFLQFGLVNWTGRRDLARERDQKAELEREQEQAGNLMCVHVCKWVWLYLKKVDLQNEYLLQVI